jgi:catechol 2,3-dioxygenase-like lactoylglutathione lyase family enzyme
MLDHLGLRVSEYAKSKRFFESALAPLGYEVVMEFGGIAHCESLRDLVRLLVAAPRLAAHRPPTQLNGYVALRATQR